MEAATAPQVIRNGRSYAVPLVVGIALLFQGLFVPNDPGLTAVQLVVGTFGLLLALWPRLILDGNGVTVVNARTRRLRWDDIDGVEIREGRSTTNLFLRTGGDEVRVFALRGARRGMLSSRELLERVAAQIDEGRRRLR